MTQEQQLPNMRGTLHGVRMVNDPSRFIWLSDHGYRVMSFEVADLICSMPARTGRERNEELIINSEPYEVPA